MTTVAYDLLPGKKLTANALFLRQDPLFVSIVGPAGVSFASIWPAATKTITNHGTEDWRLTIQASHGGPIGSDVPVWIACRSGGIVVIGVGEDHTSPEAVLTCTIVADASQQSH
jgi:hypothetical protein